MTHPVVLPSTIMRQAIRLFWFSVASLALVGCGSLTHQPTPPAKSYSVQEFEVGTSDGTEHLKGAAVSDEFFAGGKIRPMLGRAILPDEHRSIQVAMISYRFWNSKFHGDPATLGRTLQVNGQNLTIVGVMPKDFSFPDGAQLWVPLASP